MVTVPRLWPESTIVCIGSGPSLTREDVDLCRGQHVIVINTTYQLAPFAEVLYACDRKWWVWNHGAPTFRGLKYALEPVPMKFPDVHVLRNTGMKGLETDPTGVRDGHNSGYQAMNLAVHLGASRILLLGYDMQEGSHGRQHWHDPHPTPVRAAVGLFGKYFHTLVEPLQARGVTVQNCSRETALTVFPRMSLEAALDQVEVAA